MSSRLRTAMKWATRLFVALCLILAVPISALAFPYPLFDHQGKFDRCVVYSDGELDAEFAGVMKDVNRRLESVEVLPPDKANRVFLCRSQRLYSLFARLSLVNPKVQGFNLSLFGNTFVSVRRVEATRASSGGFPRYGVKEGDIAHVIAHEVIHDLSQDVIGYLKYYRLPMWKREGYAEYGAVISAIGDDAEAGLGRRIAFFMEDRDWRQGHDFAREYYRAELMVEYLIDVEGYAFEDIMADEISFDIAYTRMMAWYEKGTSHSM